MSQEAAAAAAAAAWAAWEETLEAYSREGEPIWVAATAAAGASAAAWDFTVLRQQNRYGTSKAAERRRRHKVKEAWKRVVQQIAILAEQKLRQLWRQLWRNKSYAQQRLAARGR